ncbi:UNVERIFIED_CONTAM: putative pre-mRNA-splicing factor ATP-dependent RNA helicase dhx16 [Siphonaria sp. JEL0065]|nr:putative pre-mRNA-splicing factor ATP-dependent RNA helicase dhx16 [Siphonaria sp. JEL0065]
MDERERYELDFQTSRTTLPIFQYREGLLEAFHEFQVLIVVGDTGSGKTTQLPQYLLEEDINLRIAVTQPRRIAAISAASRVATETNTLLGNRVGYAVRFESVRSQTTKLTYLTDGTLLQMTKGSLTLDEWDVVILDEAHERSLETDVLIGLLKRACKERPALKLIVMSATLNMDKFSAFFDDAPIFTVPGRMFPVDLLYARKMKMSALKGQVVAKAVEAVVQIHKSQPPGDILVFLTGQQEIEATCRMVREECDAIRSSADISHYPEVSDISLHPIYSALDTPDQKEVFRPAKRQFRKVVVATNIAQTSVTIPGIRYVVDCGFVKEKMFDASTSVDALLVVPISKAAATQRAGRSGRTAPGKVFRLYSRDAFEDMEEDTTPEIQRSSLLGIVLSLKKMGISDILNFEFIDPPDRHLLVTAMKQLHYLDALDTDGNLTPLGTTMSNLPCHPSLARSLITSASSPYNCSTELLTLVAILSNEELFHHPRQEQKRVESETSHAKFAHKSGDHIALLRVYNAWLASGESEDWCRARWIKSRSLRAVKSARGQLEDVLRDLRIPIVSCKKERRRKKGDDANRRDSQDMRSRDHLQRHHEHNNNRGSSHYHPHYNQYNEYEHIEDELDDFDYHAVIKSLCTGFFSNTAKRHPQRNHFYHYLAASGIGNNNPTSTNSTNQNSHQDSNTALLSLHIQPTSCLAGPSTNLGGISDSVSFSNLEWVLFHDIQFVNRANMRIVSRIDFGWVQEGIGKVSKCDLNRLLGVKEVPLASRNEEEDGQSWRKKRKKSIDVGEKEGVVVDDKKRVVVAVVEESVDQEAQAVKEQQERDAKAEAAKLRYLSRKQK